MSAYDSLFAPVSPDVEPMDTQLNNVVVTYPNPNAMLLLRSRNISALRTIQRMPENPLFWGYVGYMDFDGPRHAIVTKRPFVASPQRNLADLLF